MLSKIDINKIKIKMWDERITQEQVAQRMGISRQYLSRMLRRKVHNPDKEETLVALMKYWRK